MYYDRNGEPISRDEWVQSFGNMAKRRVAETTLPNGKYVSTVWLGADHNFHGGRPLIFETMVFPGETSRLDLDCERYATEAEAIAGHQAMVEKWRTGGRR